MPDEKKPLDALLKVGSAVLVHPDAANDRKTRIRTYIRGWQRANDIIIDRPEFETGWHDGDPCIVRFVCDGYAVAFASTVLKWRAKGASQWCQIQWPEQYEVVAFRKHERIEVSVPCTVRTDTGAVQQARLVDLSVGGCGLCLSARLLEGTEFHINVMLPDGTEVDALMLVCSVRPSPEGGFVVGATFEQPDEYVQSDVAFYIALLRRQQQPAVSRILIIDANLEQAGALCRTLKDGAFETYMARTTVEGFHRLCVLHPTAILINQEQPDLNGLEIYRLLKSLEQYQSIPVFLYGGDADKLRQTETVHYPAPFDAAAIAADVIARLTPQSVPASTSDAALHT